MLSLKHLPGGKNLLGFSLETEVLAGTTLKFSTLLVLALAATIFDSPLNLLVLVHIPTHTHPPMPLPQVHQSPQQVPHPCTAPAGLPKSEGMHSPQGYP